MHTTHGNKLAIHRSWEDLYMRVQLKKCYSMSLRRHTKRKNIKNYKRIYNVHIYIYA